MKVPRAPRPGPSHARNIWRFGGLHFLLAFSRPRRHPGGMSTPAEDETIFKETPEGFSLQDVRVRLARPDERLKWDRWVHRHHYLGFKRFAGRGLRYVVEWRKKWLALAGWQSGAFKCRHRDRWIGWKPDQQYRRLHLIANNTRFVILAAKGVFPALGSWALGCCGGSARTGRRTTTPGAGRREPSSRFAALIVLRWRATLGGSPVTTVATPITASPAYVYPLRRDARHRLRDPRPLPAEWQPKGPSEQAPSELRSLYRELTEVRDFRRAQGRKHSVATVLAVYILARLANLRGPVAAAEYAQKLSQRELQAIGAWKNPRTDRYVPVSKSTLHRVISSVDPDEIEAVLRRFSMPRLQLGRGLRWTASAFAAPTATETATSRRRPWSSTPPESPSPPSASMKRAGRSPPCAPSRKSTSRRVLTLDCTPPGTARVIVDPRSRLSVTRRTPPRPRLSTIDWERDRVLDHMGASATVHPGDPSRAS